MDHSLPSLAIGIGMNYFLFCSQITLSKFAVATSATQDSYYIYYSMLNILYIHNPTKLYYFNCLKTISYAMISEVLAIFITTFFQTSAIIIVCIGIITATLIIRVGNSARYPCPISI